MALGVLAAAWGVLLVAGLVLHWAILPHIEKWREPLEARAGQALGATVRIGRIEVRNGGWMPTLELRDVVLLDAQQRPALHLPRVLAAVSPRSLLSLTLRFEQLLIDGAELEVRRDRNGRIFVAGIDAGNGEDTGQHDNAAADWFFSQHEFAIRAGAVRWTDELRGTEPLVLSDVQLVVRNGLRRHELRLDATPPVAWGDRFTLMGRFTQPLWAPHGDWRRWSGSAYADLPRADVQAVRRYVTLPFELSEGAGALRGWLQLHDGRPAAATLDVALRAVGLRLAADVESLRVEEVTGRLDLQRNDEGVTLALKQLSFLTDDSVRWPAGDLLLRLRQREGRPPGGGDFSAQQLDMGQMTRIATRLPLSPALRQWLADLQPKGVVSGLSASWDGPVDAPARYRARGRISALSLASRPASEPNEPGRPGVRNATLDLSATELGGEARIEMADGALELPGIFEDPLVELDRLTAQVLWKIDRPPQPAPASAAAARSPKLADAMLPNFSVQMKNVRFANADAIGELNATWRPGTITAAGGRRFPGYLDLVGSLSQGNAARLYRYLPLGLPSGPRLYVQHAVQAGRLASATLRVKGDLADFPFRTPRSRKDSEFRVAAKVEDLRFAFVPSLPASGSEPARVSPWPALTQASADLQLDHSTLELRNGRGHLGGVEFQRAQGAVRDLGADAVLALETGARGPLDEMLRIINSTPIGGWIGDALKASTATGEATAQLALGFPLDRIEAARVKGSLTLNDNGMRLTPDTPALDALKARVDFTEKGFTLGSAAAQVLGGAARFEGGVQADGTVRIQAHGTATAEALGRATELGPVARAASVLSGQTSYRLNLAFAHGRPEVDLTSNLVGMAIDLPTPLGKSAEVPLAMTYRLGPTDLATVGGVRAALPSPLLHDTLRFELGGVAQARFDRELTGETTRVLRGGIGIGEPAPLPASGVALNIRLKSLVTDTWSAAANRLFDTADGGASAAKPGGVATVEGRAFAAPSGYVPDTIALNVQELTAGGRRLTHVVAGLSQQAGLWRTNLEADQLSGYVEYRPSQRPGPSASTGERVYARLSRLSLPQSEAEQIESLLAEPPASLPALDIVVDDFELRGRHLGRVEIEAINRGVGATAEGAWDWVLSKFNVGTPEAQLTATGQWASAGVSTLPRGAPAPARRTVIDFKLALLDSGALLDRLGMPGAIRGGKGQLSGQVAWTGSPFALDYPSLSGQFNVAIDAGQFLKAEPGVARLLGVLSLQSLPRRLSFDFRDVFAKGFAFDKVTGDVTIAQGVATTNNLRMRGVQAAVLMEGSADIARETQDLHAVVVPEINAGSAALAFAVINPALGLGAFLAQALLKKPLEEAGTREFHVTGSWEDPKVERVEPGVGGEVPAVDGPASAPSTAASAPP